MNRLSLELSPYLQQHQHNPVDWYPWGDEAFRKAKEENKPIFLSIGYSTCHWCHVMERESFENEQIAALMNRYFVNIKVDREERPDVDRVYMSAVQTMVGHGGWPLSVFLTPDLKPFYGGTYFPPKDGHGRPGFPTLLERIREVWEKERENVIHSGDELTRQLQHRHPVNTGAAEVDATILKRTYHQIAAGYDPKNAGFGTGTKFPRPVVFNFLFRYYQRTGDQEALKMSLTTLMAMASGGMADHLGGGFHRYSVDPQWRVPHFEKMLYDQAQLVHSYLDAWQISGDHTFAAIAQRTVDYVLRDMTSPDGAFCSAEDADSADPSRPGHPVEGAFYVWTKQEIDSLLTAEESRVFCLHYSIEEQGNVQHDPHREFEGRNILFNPFTPEQTAQHAGMTADRVTELLASAERKLFEARNRRPRPLRDDKVLTSWNGLMISACARAASVLKHDAYRAAAERAAQFILTRMTDPEHHILSRRYRNNEAKFDAHLEDYAAMIDGLLELFQCSSELRWLRTAEQLAGTMITRFWDSAEGGFYDTSGKDPSVLVRTKEAYDGAEPTGNALAAGVLLKLFHLTNDDRYRQYAEKTIRYFCVLLEQSPQIMPQMMAVVERFLAPPQHLVLAVNDARQMDAMLDVLRPIFLPHCSVIVLSEENRAWFTQRAPFMREMHAGAHGAAAFVCSDYSCQLPANEPEELHRQLSALNIARTVNR